MKDEELKRGIDLILNSDSFNNELTRETLKHIFSEFYFRLDTATNQLKIFERLLSTWDGKTKTLSDATVLHLNAENNALRDKIAELKNEVDDLQWWREHGQLLRNAIAKNLTDKCGDDDLVNAPKEAKEKIEILTKQVADGKEAVEAIKKIFDYIYEQ